MRLTVLAVGQARGTSEGGLTDDYIARAAALGKRMGFSRIAVEETGNSKARSANSRMSEECARLAGRVPRGAHVRLLDARGKGMTSEDFSEALGALRDAGTYDLAFIIGGPDGLAAL